MPGPGPSSRDPAEAKEPAAGVLIDIAAGSFVLLFAGTILLFLGLPALVVGGYILIAEVPRASGWRQALEAIQLAAVAVAFFVLSAWMVWRGFRIFSGRGESLLDSSAGK